MPTRIKDFLQFDPEGEGYDILTAIVSGLKPQMMPDGKLHWGSRDPMTGMILKGRKHPTWDLMMEEEMRRGNMIVKRKGRYYSVRVLGGMPE